MSIATPPVALAHVSLAEWDTDWSQREDAYELVDGIPTVAPNETFRNVDATMMLADRLRMVRPAWRPLAHFAIHLGEHDGRHTIRQPDLAVVRQDADPMQHRVEAAEVALVVEVISPGSVETDVVTKRAEYARAGVPAYLLVDVRGTRPTVVLFDEIVDGAYLTPDTDGAAVTLHIGEHAISLLATDLVA